MPDYHRLIAGQTAVVDLVNSGSTGLPVLARLVETAQAALGARGASFAEYGPSGGRIIAASGACAWALGRPVDATHPAVRRHLAGPRSWDVPVDVLETGLARQLSRRGLRRMLGARAEVSGLVVGSLHAYYPDAEGRAGAEAHAVVAFVAACAGHLYDGQAGLPVHGHGPIVAALADGLAVVDAEGTVTLWNPAAERITGRSATTALGQPLPFPAPPPGQVLEHRLPGGRRLTVTAGELPGGVDARVVTFRDAVDQHRLHHDRDLFVAVTSHELRTPVTVIKGYADTLGNHWGSLDEPTRREAVRVIGQRAGELASLVDRLLCTASGAAPLDAGPPEPFDLAEALAAAVAELPADLRGRVALDLPADLPKALGDRASLPTVVTELATNAEKYSPVGSPVEVAAGFDETTVFYRISDRGIGVRPEHVERAFDRFWQAESGDRRRFPGAGLGLYLVRRIVERQNGWVSLRPRGGGGTVAEVRMPRGDLTMSGGA